MDSADIVFDDEGNNVFCSLCVSGGRLNAYAALTAVALHNFGAWKNADLTYHERVCTTCGYIQRQDHSDCWGDLRNRCFACGRTGPVPVNPFFFSIEKEELGEAKIIEYTDVA